VAVFGRLLGENASVRWRHPAFWLWASSGRRKLREDLNCGASGAALGLKSLQQCGPMLGAPARVPADPGRDSSQMFDQVCWPQGPATESWVGARARQRALGIARSSPRLEALGGPVPSIELKARGGCDRSDPSAMPSSNESIRSERRKLEPDRGALASNVVATGEWIGATLRDESWRFHGH
jgi:hypothetical protein